MIELLHVVSSNPNKKGTLEAQIKNSGIKITLVCECDYWNIHGMEFDTVIIDGDCTQDVETFAGMARSDIRDKPSTGKLVFTS